MPASMIEFNALKNFQDLHYGFSLKSDGFMNFRKSGDPKILKTSQFNREKFYAKSGLPRRVIFPSLAHSGDVVIVNADNWRDVPQGDAFLTAEPELALVATMADCFPVYFYDSKNRAIGLAHAGWKGVLKGIISNTISAFKRDFGSKAEDIFVGIGPGIRNCHFFIKDDVIGLFSKHKNFISNCGDGYAADLEGIIIDDAKKEGVLNIQSAGICTYCRGDLYFSFRRDKPEIPSVMLAYIWRENITK